MKWIVLISGGPMDSPWTDKREVEADSFMDAVNKAHIVNNGGYKVDGVVRADVLDDIWVSPNEKAYQ